MAFTFAAFCYMLTLVLCAALIFFVIWQVSLTRSASVVFLFFFYDLILKLHYIFWKEEGKRLRNHVKNFSFCLLKSNFVIVVSVSFLTLCIQLIYFYSRMNLE